MQVDKTFTDRKGKIMESQEDILLKYFTEQNIKGRERATKALEVRDFETLRNNSWVKRETIEEVLEERGTQEMIDRLQSAMKSIAPNQTTPVIGTHIIQEEEKWAEGVDIYLTSYLYSIVAIEACERSAFHFTKSCMWKIKHQPNGKDTKRYLEIIDSYTN